MRRHSENTLMAGANAGYSSNAECDSSVTGHGSYSGYNARSAWQDASANGITAANEVCNNCPDLDFSPISSSVNAPSPFRGSYPIFPIYKEGEQ